MILTITTMLLIPANESPFQCLAHGLHMQILSIELLAALVVFESELGKRDYEVEDILGEARGRGGGTRWGFWYGKRFCSEATQNRMASTPNSTLRFRLKYPMIH